MAKRDYEVGYGKPPKGSQFQKGKSGNPTGGGKKPKSEKAILQKMLGRKRMVQTPDGPVKMDGLELIALRLFNDALAGKARQLKILLDRVDANGIGRQEAGESLSAADAHVYDQYFELLRGAAGGSDDV